MPYNPASAFQIPKRGVNGAALAETIGSLIAQHSQQKNELTATKKLLEAYADDPSSGIDPDSIDKMTLGQAKGTLMAVPVRRAITSAKQQASSLAQFFTQTNRDQQPSPNLSSVPGDPNNAIMRGIGMSAGTDTAPVMKPGMSLRDAIIDAASKNPAVLQTDNPASKAFGGALAAALKAPQGNPQLDPSGRFFMSETGWRPVPAANVRAAAGGGTTQQPRANPAATLDPDEELVPYTPPGSKTPVPGLYKRMKDGKSTGWWQDPQAQPRAAGATGNGKLSFTDLLTQADGGDGGGAAPAGKEAVGGYEVGAKYNGMTYTGGDPNDEANWEK